MCLCMLGFLSKPSPQKEQENCPPICRLCSCMSGLCDLVLCLSRELFRRKALLQNEQEKGCLTSSCVVFLGFDNLAWSSSSLDMIPLDSSLSTSSGILLIGSSSNSSSNISPNIASQNPNVLLQSTPTQYGYTIGATNILFKQA